MFFIQTYVAPGESVEVMLMAKQDPEDGNPLHSAFSGFS